MQLLLFRHGIAAEPAQGGDDASRQLTEEGVEKTRQAAAGLARLADAPAVILTSPMTRAVETADILGEAFGLKPVVFAPLADDDPTQVLRGLRSRKEKAILLVGHEPGLTRLLERLCTGDNAGGFVDLKKAGCACVDTGPLGRAAFKPGRLLWLATPRMLRAAGK